jgi:hypothetical protein
MYQLMRTFLVGLALAGIGACSPKAASPPETNSEISQATRPAMISTADPTARQPSREKPSNAEEQFDYSEWKRGSEQIRRMGGTICDRTPWKSGCAYVMFRREDFSDKVVEQLKGIPEIGTLDLRDTQLSDAGLEHLKDMTQLQGLCLEGTQVTDAGLRHLHGLSGLRYLNLCETRVTDAGLAHLNGLAQLKELQLADTNVTTEGVNRLQRALPKCKIDWRPPTSDERQSPAAPDQLR